MDEIKVWSPGEKDKPKSGERRRTIDEERMKEGKEANRSLALCEKSHLRKGNNRRRSSSFYLCQPLTGFPPPPGNAQQTQNASAQEGQGSWFGHGRHDQIDAPETTCNE